MSNGGPKPGMPKTDSFGTVIRKAQDADFEEKLAAKERPPDLSALYASPPAAEVRGPSGRWYGSTSLFCLPPAALPRRLAIRAVEHPVFDPLILTTIIANCATMAWDSPLDPGHGAGWADGDGKTRLLIQCNWVYLIIFTVELLLKVVAYGFAMHPNAYLRDAWCQLDFVVVSLAWMPILIPGFGNYSVIRSVRALRPLRALKRVPGMPVLVSSVLASLPGLASVGVLCGFVFLVFGIVGLELFKGAFHYRCALPGFADLVAVGGSIEEEAQFDSGVLCVMDAASAAVQGRMLRGGGGGGGGSGGASPPLPRPIAPAAPASRARPFLITPEEGEGGTFSQHPPMPPDLSHPPPFPASQEAQAAPTSRCALTSRRPSTASRRSTTSAGRSSSSCRR